MCLVLCDAREIHLAQEETITWPAKTFGLYANPKGNTLFILKRKGAKKQKLDMGNGEIQRGVELYGRFQDFSPGCGTVLKTGGVESAKKIGRVSNILYSSSKWGDKNVLYIHTFKVQPIFRINERTRCAIISGGKIRVTKRGIEG